MYEFGLGFTHEEGDVGLLIQNKKMCSCGIALAE
jgi:hypothetical protein